MKVIATVNSDVLKQNDEFELSLKSIKPDILMQMLHVKFAIQMTFMLLVANELD